jgi:hypothetical protein
MIRYGLPEIALKAMHTDTMDGVFWLGHISMHLVYLEKIKVTWQSPKNRLC